MRFKNITEPLIVNNTKRDICVKDNNYVWYELYPKSGNYALTIMFDDKDNLIEWYFDIAKTIGIDNDIPYEVDLYLDMVITKEGEEIVLDKEELLDAYKNGIITKEDVDGAFETLNFLEETYAKNFDMLIILTKEVKSLFDKYK